MRLLHLDPASAIQKFKSALIFGEKEHKRPYELAEVGRRLALCLHTQGDLAQACETGEVSLSRLEAFQAPAVLKRLIQRKTAIGRAFHSGTGNGSDLTESLDSLPAKAVTAEMVLEEVRTQMEKQRQRINLAEVLVDIAKNYFEDDASQHRGYQTLLPGAHQMLAHDAEQTAAELTSWFQVGVSCFLACCSCCRLFSLFLFLNAVFHLDTSVYLLWCQCDFVLCISAATGQRLLQPLCHGVCVCFFVVVVGAERKSRSDPQTLRSERVA